MFDIGFLELLLIGVLALLVLGPERLPGAARTAGRFVARARSLARGLQNQLREEMAREEARLKEGLGVSAPDDTAEGEPEMTARKKPHD